MNCTTHVCTMENTIRVVDGDVSVDIPYRNEWAHSMYEYVEALTRAIPGLTEMIYPFAAIDESIDTPNMLMCKHAGVWALAITDDSGRCTSTVIHNPVAFLTAWKTGIMCKDMSIVTSCHGA